MSGRCIGIATGCLAGDQINKKRVDIRGSGYYKWYTFRAQKPG